MLTLIMVCRSSRLIDKPDLNSYATVHCNDCQITEPTPFSTVWWSHKTNSASLRYEIAISIESCRVV